MQKTKRILMVSISLMAGALLAPLIVLGTNHLQNRGLEAPFIFYATDTTGYDKKVAEHWERFFVPENTYNNGSRLRFYSASDWAAYNGSQVTERVEGDDAQVWWQSSTKKFDAGIYQQVNGLTIGENYGFQAAVLQAFESTTRSNPATGEMLRRWGIDPYGGTVVTSANVIWSPEEPYAAYQDPVTQEKFTWFWGSVGAQAMSTTMTVFVRVSSSNNGNAPHSNQVWADDAYFDIAPTTGLTLTKISPTQVRADWNGQPRSGFIPYAFEAQYRLLTDTTWTDLQVFDVLDASPPTGSNANFTITAGQTYIVRARTWHRIEKEVSDDGRQHELAGPWVEAQYPPDKIIGSVIGKVRYNRLEEAAGAALQVAGEMTSTTSTSDGAYKLVTGAGTFGITASTVSGWTAPLPVNITVVATETTPLTITLRASNDMLLPQQQAGDFEGTLNNWDSAITQPTFITQNHRSGNSSLCVSGSGAFTFTGQVQDMYRPTLSFWYKVEGNDGDDSLIAKIFGPDNLTPTQPLTFTEATNGWRYAYLPLDLQGVSGGGTGSFGGGSGTFDVPAAYLYNGDLGIRFTVNQNGPSTTTFCLDEVGVGKSLGGAYQIYLPLVVKNYSSPTPPGTVIPPQCPVTSTATYDLIPFVGLEADHPDYLHGDFNLSRRSYITVTADLKLVDYTGGTDPGAPLLSGIFQPDRTPAFSNAYQVYDWDWVCGGVEHGCQGSLLNEWPTTLLGMETTPGEDLTFPSNRGSAIYQSKYYAMVLYAEEQRITLTYIREDRAGVANGYAVHIEGICVDSNLLALYQGQVDENGNRTPDHQLPGLENGQIIGAALGEQIKVAIRDKGKFMDPRSGKDWW